MDVAAADLMANLLRQNPYTVWLEVRLPREAFDNLVARYGSSGHALGALRESLPGHVSNLAPRLPSSTATAEDWAWWEAAAALRQR